MSPVLRRIIALLLLTGMLLSACGSDLWGASDLLLTKTPTSSWTLTPTDLPPTRTLSPPTPTDTPLPPTETVTSSGPTPTPNPPILYYSQSGDSLPAVAAHFGVNVSEITSPVAISPTGLIDPDTPLVVPNRLNGTMTSSERIMPDSEVVYSPSAADFDIESYVMEQGGYLSTYQEYLMSTAMTSGAQAVQRMALENSSNPRVLLALIEYESGWVRGQPSNLAQTDYPLGHVDLYYRGLYRQMMWAVQQLSLGYYGWRSGALTELTFLDGTTMRISPQLNAGTVALQYYFAQRFNSTEWARAIDPNTGFPALYAELFPDPWLRAQAVEPLFPPGLTQPVLSLPFEPGRVWSFSNGPHGAYDQVGPQAALDFAPASAQSGCVKSDFWILAPAAGRIARSETGEVILDLDPDGHEQTGWDLIFLHVAADGRAQQGAWLSADDKIGHPGCEVGIYTGTHVHIARKYNGEWVLADGPLPFTMSGWVAHGGVNPGEGTLTKGDQVVIAKPTGTYDTQIIRQPDE